MNMMWKFFSQYDDSKVEMSLSPIESMSYDMNCVGLNVKALFHAHGLNIRINISL